MLDSSELEDSGRRIEKEKDVYRKIKLLGQGAFGKAYLVECRQDSTLWVIKQIDMSGMSADERQVTAREVQILEKLDHPNIVKFREIYRTSKQKLSFVMEYADGGDLASRIAEQKRIGKLLSEVEVLNCFTQICLAVKHVHDRKIIHRDIKGQNIFLMQDNTVKLGDFGIARVLHRTAEKAKTVVGTPYYLSPEIIESKPYSFKSDIWSLGVLLYEMCALQPPFNGNSLQFLALKIVKGAYASIPPVYSKGLQNLIRGMLSVDPNKRPTIHQILSSSLLMDRITNFLSESKKEDEFSHTVLHNQNILKRPIVPLPRKSQQPEASVELGAPPNLLKVNEPRLPTPKSTEVVRQKEKDVIPVPQNHFHQMVMPQPIKQHKTPPTHPKGPINGFYRPPSSHAQAPKHIFNQKPDLADLLNIKAPPLNAHIMKAHIMKAPLPKLKTPQADKKRPSTPNLNLAVVPEPMVMHHKPSVEMGADFRKKPRYSAEENIRRNCSEDKMAGRPIAHQKAQILKAEISPILIDKSPLIGGQRSPQLGAAALIPTPKQQRKQAIKPQSANNFQKKKVDLKPIPKKESPPAKKEVTKDLPAKPKKDSKKAPKKKQKPLDVKSQQVKKHEKQEVDRKKQRREQQRRKMKEDIEQRRRILSTSGREEGIEQEKLVQKHEQEKVNQLQQEQYEVMKTPATAQQSTELIEQDINYGEENFEVYTEQHPIALVHEQELQRQAPEIQQYQTAPQLEQGGKVQIKHSLEFKKMLEEMQSLVDHATERVGQLSEVPPVATPPKMMNPPELQELRMELTIRQDDLESVANSASQSELEYSLSQDGLALECLGDHSKLEDLKITLEEVFGIDHFIAAYRRIERLVEAKGLDFDEIQTVRNIAREIEGISQASLAKYFSLLVTLVYMQNNFME